MCSAVHRSLYELQSEQSHKTDNEHVLHLPLPTRVARLVLSRLALLAQKLVNIALRRHGAILDRSGDIHDLLRWGLLRLLLLLLRWLLRLMMRHRRMLVNVHSRLRLGLLVMLRILRPVVIQRRVERKVCVTHSGGGRGKGPVAVFQKVAAMLATAGLKRLLMMLLEIDGFARLAGPARWTADQGWRRRLGRRRFRGQGLILAVLLVGSTRFASEGATAQMES